MSNVNNNEPKTWAVYNADTGAMVGKRLTEQEAYKVSRSVTRAGKTPQIVNEPWEAMLAEQERDAPING